MEPVICKQVAEPERGHGSGESCVYRFRFSAVPERYHQKLRQTGHVYHFVLQLRVTAAFLASGTWPRVPEEDRQRYFFQLVADELKKRRPPQKDPTGRDWQVVPGILLDVGHELAKGPETFYDLAKIDPTAEFTIGAKSGAAGLQTQPG